MLKHFFAGAILLLTAAFAAAQSGQKQIAELKEGFYLKTGASFEASTAGSSKAASATKIIGGDFSEAVQLIKQFHIDGKKLTLEKLTKTAIEKMLKQLDPHSSFYDEREYAEMRSDQHSEYFGIGTTMKQFKSGRQNGTFIVSTFPRSPAYRAGLRFGDKILKVDGIAVEDWSVAEIKNKIRGEQGTLVRLSVKRAATNQTETITMRREPVSQPSIPDAYVLRDKTGYIDLSGGFNFTTSDELNAALENLKQQGADSLILDLRDNPGGLVEQAVRVAEKFLPPGKTIVSQSGRSEHGQRFWQSNKNDYVKMPLVILVNENTASASEIVAGALQDYNRALLIGETTFGKGLVQSVLDLPGGCGLVLTVSRYHTPAGRSLQRDYVGGENYDYFARSEKAAIQTAEVKTNEDGASKHGGIKPDLEIKNHDLSQPQSKILDSLFFFSRELVNARISGFEHLAVARTPQFGKRIQKSDFTVDENLFKAFQKFAVESSQIRAAMIEKEREFTFKNLRFNLINAAYGLITANQVLIENDSQVARAVKTLQSVQK